MGIRVRFRLGSVLGISGSLSISIGRLPGPSLTTRTKIKIRIRKSLSPKHPIVSSSSTSQNNRETKT